MRNISNIGRENALKLLSIISDLNSYPKAITNYSKETLNFIKLVQKITDNDGYFTESEWELLLSLIKKLFNEGSSGEGSSSRLIDESYDKVTCEFNDDWDESELRKKKRKVLDEKREQEFMMRLTHWIFELLYELHRQIDIHNKIEANKTKFRRSNLERELL